MSSVKLVLPPCCEKRWQESVKALAESHSPLTSQGSLLPAHQSSLQVVLKWTHWQDWPISGKKVRNLEPQRKTDRLHRGSCLLNVVKY